MIEPRTWLVKDVVSTSAGGHWGVGVWGHACAGMREQNQRCIKDAGSASVSFVQTCGRLCHTPTYDFEHP